jgi:signal transduction histidine kinase
MRLRSSGICVNRSATPMIYVYIYIYIYIQVMDMDASQEQRQLCEQIGHASETLLGLVNNILDLARIEKGRVVLDYESFDVR